ncbi:MAG: cell division protein ZipA [Pseudomonadota bacterium]|nr:cell division protein ZipA [Pseudomonadota bacterium]
MSPRELIIFLLGLAIVAVILRGLYVAMQARRGQIKLVIDKNIPQDVDLDALEMAELPSGGARVVERSLAVVNSKNSAIEAAKIRAASLGLGAAESGEESIPVLMDPVEISEAQEEETIEESLSYSEDNYGDPDSVLFDYSDNNHRDERDSNDFEDTEDTEDTENSRPSMYREDNLSSVMPSYPDDEWGDEEDEEEGEIPEGFHEEDFGDSSYADDEWGSSDISDEKEEIDEEVASDEEIIAAFKSRQASSSSVDVVDEAFDDIDGYDFDDEDEKVVTEAGETDKRKEPTIGGSLEDSLDEFSMTAGERIGHHDADEQETHQSELLEDDGPEEETAVAPKEKFRFRSFLSVFSRSEKKELPLREQREEARDEALFEEAENEIQTTNQAFEEDNIAHIEEAASARASGVEISPNAGRSIEQETSHQSEVIVINVMAQEGRVFEGNDLLQVLVTAGLRFGEMNIFHHRLNNKNKGPLIFSVANILNPGTFDLNEMEEFSTIGISLFLALPAQINNLQAFEQMLEVAQQVRGALDGELKDDHRSIMTAQTIEHYRQRIRDFELRQLKAAGSRA